MAISTAASQTLFGPLITLLSFEFELSLSVSKSAADTCGDEDTGQEPQAQGEMASNGCAL